MPVKEAEVTITFQPSGHSVQTRSGRQLLAIIRDAGLPIGYSCRGQGVCTACVVSVSGPISVRTPGEQVLLSRVEDRSAPHGEELRISCLVRVQGDVKVRADYW